MSSSYPNLEPAWRFRICLGSALLFLTIALLVLAGLVWFFSEWELGELGQNPAIPGGVPPEPWVFFGAIFVAVMVSPLLGIAYEPFLRHLAVNRGFPISPPIAAGIATPFWYAAFIPTFALTMEMVDSSTRTLLLLCPLFCAALTGALHLLMVHVALRPLRKKTWVP